jgi:hypothetical protein
LSLKSDSRNTDRTTDKDVWWVDALIVDPWQNMFYLGEATYNLKPNPLLKKLRTFAARKSEVLARLGHRGAPPGWDIRPWLFLRKDAIAYVIKKLPAGLHPRLPFSN